MKKPITVKILVTVPDAKSFDACTLCFETLRVGWPTANIHIYVNGGAFYGDISAKIAKYALLPIDLHATGRVDVAANCPVHLADWIREQTQQSYNGPLIIADPDIVYWKSCEDWAFPESTLLAGYYNPRMWNDFAKCVSVERIHTSMMVFPNVEKLWATIYDAYPFARMKHGEYCPCDPFMGRVMFEDGRPVFWDCGANLYNMLRFVSPSHRAASVFYFGKEEKECYDHLNSASFRQVMSERLDPHHSQGFLAAHELWVKNPQPGLWALTDEYYTQKRIEGWMRQPGL